MSKVKFLSCKWIGDGKKKSIRYSKLESSIINLYANLFTKITLLPYKTAIIPTGWIFAIPKNTVIQIIPYDKLFIEQKLIAFTTFFEYNYRKEITVLLYNQSSVKQTIKPDQKIAQLLIHCSHKPWIVNTKTLPTID